jgi:hypothetical protein
MARTADTGRPGQQQEEEEMTMSYIHPEREDFVADEVRYLTPVNDPVTERTWIERSRSHAAGAGRLAVMSSAAPSYPPHR